jgi:hypothetical protein
MAKNAPANNSKLGELTKKNKNKIRLRVESIISMDHLSLDSLSGFLLSYPSQ